MKIFQKVHGKITNVKNITDLDIPSKNFSSLCAVLNSSILIPFVLRKLQVESSLISTRTNSWNSASPRIFF
jgi:hypothetical protein